MVNKKLLVFVFGVFFMFGIIGFGSADTIKLNSENSKTSFLDRFIDLFNGADEGSKELAVINNNNNFAILYIDNILCF